MYYNVVKILGSIYGYHTTEAYNKTYCLCIRTSTSENSNQNDFVLLVAYTNEETKVKLAKEKEIYKREAEFIGYLDQIDYVNVLIINKIKFLDE